MSPFEGRMGLCPHQLPAVSCPECRVLAATRKLNQVQQDLGLEDARLKLGVDWPIDYEIRPNEETCRIISDPAAQQHHVWFPLSAIENPELFRPDVMHELCHAKLSEDVDPAFSTLYFAKKYRGMEPKQRELFQRKALQLKQAWDHVDLWVNDLRHQHWPELTLADVSSATDGLEVIQSRGDAVLDRPDLPIMVAINLVEIERHQLGEAEKDRMERVIAALPKEQAATVARLDKFYRTIPPLQMDATPDLKLLQETVQRSAKLQGMSFIPKLITEQNRRVWLFEKR